MQDVTGDANDPLDQGLPFGVGHHPVRAENICGPGFMAIARGGDRGVAAGGKEGCAGGFGILQQGGLIVLQLDNDMRLGLRGGLEGFFWQCSASRVMVLCATWSSPSNCCAAGISLDFSSISICARTRPALVSNACSNWAVCGAPHTAHDAESAGMRSDTTRNQELPGLRQCCAPHNSAAGKWPAVQAALPQWSALGWSGAIFLCQVP